MWERWWHYIAGATAAVMGILWGMWQTALRQRNAARRERDTAQRNADTEADRRRVERDVERAANQSREEAAESEEARRNRTGRPSGEFGSDRLRDKD